MKAADLVFQLQVLNGCGVTVKIITDQDFDAKVVFQGLQPGKECWAVFLIDAGQGHRVTIQDPDPAEAEYPEVEELGDAAMEADLIIIAVAVPMIMWVWMP